MKWFHPDEACSGLNSQQLQTFHDYYCNECQLKDPKKKTVFHTSRFYKSQWCQRGGRREKNWVGGV